MAATGAGNSSHDPDRLWEASVQRMDTAWQVWEIGQDWPAAVYLAGLAVELILQALAHLDHDAHDARHNLDLWLDKCSPDLQNDMKVPQMRADWSRINTGWHNGLRYYAESQWLGEIRKSHDWQKLKGDDSTKMRQYSRVLLNAADRVHQKGLREWERKTN